MYELVEHALAGIGTDDRRAATIHLMFDGRSQVFSVRAHLVRGLRVAQERRDASSAVSIDHHACMTGVEWIDGGHIDKH